MDRPQPKHHPVCAPTHHPGHLRCGGDSAGRQEWGLFRGSREPGTEHSYWGRCARSQLERSARKDSDLSPVGLIVGTILKSRLPDHPTSAKGPWGPLVSPHLALTPFLEWDGGRQLKIALGHYSSTALCPAPRSSSRSRCFQRRAQTRAPGENRKAVCLWLPWRSRLRASESRSRRVNGTHTLLNSQLLSGNCQAGPWLSLPGALAPSP